MHMLAAIDLGGTHCRFARFAATPRGLDLEAVETCPTAGLQDSDTVLQQWESCLHTPLSRVAALVMGVAGPVQDGLRARLSNAPLRIDLNAVMPQFGLRRARVVNDFVCEACACLTRVGERSLHLLGPADIPCPSHRSPGEAPAPVAVLGAGTGLGSGWLVPQADGGRLRWSPLPSESGHQAFAFLGREEEDFAVFARERLGRSLLRPDDVVTGRGLAVLHHFLTGRDLTPAAAADEGLVGDQPTLRWYARFLGRTCAHWGLATLCYSGLFLTGGMVLRNPVITEHPAFAEGFSLAPELGVLERIPVRRYTDAYSGLWGAAWLAGQLAVGNTTDS